MTSYIGFQTIMINNVFLTTQGCTIAVKAENLNPGGSVKDRAALFLVKDAEEKGH